MWILWHYETSLATFLWSKPSLLNSIPLWNHCSLYAVLCSYMRVCQISYIHFFFHCRTCHLFGQCREIQHTKEKKKGLVASWQCFLSWSVIRIFNLNTDWHNFPCHAAEAIHIMVSILSRWCFQFSFASPAGIPSPPCFNCDSLTNYTYTQHKRHTLT